MSEYYFGLGSGHLPKRADKIASKHDACLVNYTEPGTGVKRHWFATRNYGHPHDQATAQAVIEDLKKAGLA